VALRLPARDERIERGDGDREVELHVAIEIVMVAPRHVLRKTQPVPALAGRSRTVAHELDDCLLLRRQRIVHRQHGGGLLAQQRIVRGRQRQRLGAELRRRFERERLDAIPVRHEEARSELRAVGTRERDRLPAVRIDDAIGRVHGLVVRVVAVGRAVAAGFVAELVAAVVHAVGEHRGGCDVADPLWRGRVCRRVVGVVAERLHAFAQEGGIGRVDAEQRPIVRVGDRLVLVRERALRGRAAQAAAEPAADRLVVVGRPGVEHRHGPDHHLPRQHGGARAVAFHVARRDLLHDVVPSVCVVLIAERQQLLMGQRVFGVSGRHGGRARACGQEHCERHPRAAEGQHQVIPPAAGREEKCAPSRRASR
jgi:hypothetical protein